MKTNMKVSTDDCGHCGKGHDGFRLKLDSKGVEYIICGSGKTAKRVDVKLRNLISKNPYQPGTWRVDEE